MPTPPKAVFIFHFTAISNLRSILEKGCLMSNNFLARKGIITTNVSHSHIQQRRHNKILENGFTLHDYVPFMFAPCSPMMYAIINGNVPEAEETEQEKLIYFVSTAKTIQNLGLEFIFSDYHAVVKYATFYENLKDLDKINWDLFFEEPLKGGYCKYFNNRPEPQYIKRSETRNAEFLIKDKVFITDKEHFSIAVKSDKIKNEVEKLLKETNINIDVIIEKDWYF